MPATARRPHYRWNVAAADTRAARLAQELNTAPLVAQVLCNRGIADAAAAAAFLSPKLNDLAAPELLPGIESAAGLIARAIRDRRKITIYGDYDVDGMTAIAILQSCLKMLGADVNHYVPHRLQEGYGVNRQALASLAAEGTGLLVTVDCGISALEPLEAASAAGMEVIVTDHHAPGPRLPRVSAVVHPAVEGSAYPNKDLCGAGVAFKLAWQVARTMQGAARLDEPMRRFLLEATCLAALGTIADVVPLVGENRVFATFGLRGLPNVKHTGLRALLASAKLETGKLDAYHVGFVLAPRLNACGRMGHAELAVELLTDAPPDRARQIADYLEQQNELRRQVERDTTAQAVEMVRSRGFDSPDRRAIVLEGPDWHGGVIGIVAARLVEMFRRPVVLIALDGDELAHGSCRSIAGYHMRDALAACAEHLEEFGGHAMAGGLRIRPEKIDAFREAFVARASGSIPPESLEPSLSADAETTTGSLGYNVVEHLSRLAPFGQGNPAPLVVLRNCRILVPPRRLGQRGATVSLMLEQNGLPIRAVGFNMGELADELAGAARLDLVAQPVLNSFNGSTSVELRIRDVRY